MTEEVKGADAGATIPAGAVTPQQAFEARTAAWFGGEPEPVFSTKPPEGTPVEKPAEVKTPEAEVKAPEVKAPEAAPVETPVLDPRAQALAQLRSGLSGEPIAPVEPPKEVLDWATSAGLTKDDILGIPSLREQAAKAAEASGQVASIQKMFASLPKELQVAIDKAARNDEGWRNEIVQTPQLDWSRGFEKQDPQEVVNKLVPGRVSDDVWREYKSGDADHTTKMAVEAVIELARTKFDTEKTRLDSHFENERAAQERDQKALSMSVDREVSDLQRSLPGIMPLLPEIKEHLSHDGIHRLFFENHNTLRPGAAKMLTYALYHKELGESAVAKQVKEHKNAIELEQIRRTPEVIADQAKNHNKDTQKTPQQIAEERVAAWFGSGK